MTDPLIAVTGLKAGYPGRPVLRGIDLGLYRGERLALLGANGAGKSTLLMTLLGLLPKTGGTITAFGWERRIEPDFVDLRRRVGLVFQDPDDQLFCPTVREDIAFGPLNLGLGQHEAFARAEAVLADLGLSDLADRITHRLSGGEKRLVSIAAVLAMEPDVLLLDEPTTGLDEPAYERLLALLAGLEQAMIIVAHDARFVARLATRAVLIADGTSHPGFIHTHEHAHAHLHLPGDGRH